MMMDDFISKCNTSSYDLLFFPHLCILLKHLELINFSHQYSILIYSINHAPSTSNSITNKMFIPGEKLWPGFLCTVCPSH